MCKVWFESRLLLIKTVLDSDPDLQLHFIPCPLDSLPSRQELAVLDGVFIYVFSSSEDEKRKKDFLHRERDCEREPLCHLGLHLEVRYNHPPPQENEKINVSKICKIPMGT